MKNTDQKIIPRSDKAHAVYTSALSRILEIFDAKRGTPEGEEFELLARIIEIYEKDVF